MTRIAFVGRLSKLRICKQHQSYDGGRKGLCFVFFNPDTFPLNKQRQLAITVLEIDLARDKKVVTKINHVPKPTDEEVSFLLFCNQETKCVENCQGARVSRSLTCAL